VHLDALLRVLIRPESAHSEPSRLREIAEYPLALSTACGVRRSQRQIVHTGRVGIQAPRVGRWRTYDRCDRSQQMYREPGGVVFVNSRGFRIRYQVSGSGPVLLLLHGFPMWGDRWRDRGYVSVLQGRFHLVVPDLLGHGKSDKPHRPADYGVPNLASDVIAVLDAAGVERAHFWGYSLGTMVAENLAVTVPDRVLSLTLGGFPPGLDLDQRRAMFPPAKAPASRDEIFHGWPEPLIGLYKANTDLAAVQAIWASLGEQPTTIADLQSSPHPTLAYIGAEDPLLEVTGRQCAALPCRLEVVPGDHMAGFAQAGNILPLAVSHIEASAPPIT